MISCFRLKSILSSILGSFFLLLASMSLISLAVMLRLSPVVMVGPSGEWDGLGLLRIELPRLPRTCKGGLSSKHDPYWNWEEAGKICCVALLLLPSQSRLYWLIAGEGIG